MQVFLLIFGFVRIGLLFGHMGQIVGDSRGVLVWESKHLRQQIAVVKVLLVVYLVADFSDISEDILDHRHNLLVLQVTLPVKVVVALLWVVQGRTILDGLVVFFVLEHNF